MNIDKFDTYLTIVGKEYETLKQGINIESFKRFNTEINEDIFHDTIIKCIEKIRYEELTIQQVLNYIFVSYINNVKREKLYARNLYHSDTEISELNGGVTTESMDYKIIIEEMKEIFGEEDVNNFLSWIDGESVREINERCHTTNFRYKLDKMRDYIKKAGF